MNGTILGMTRKEISIKLDDIVDFAGVAKYVDTPVKRYSSGMMVPRNSVSMVIGIGPRMATWTRAEVCARCSLKETCPHRIRA